MGMWPEVSEEQKAADMAAAKAAADQLIADAAAKAEADRLASEAEQQQFAASEVSRVDMDKMRALGERMRAEGKPFLTHEEMDELVSRVNASRGEKENTPSPEQRAASAQAAVAGEGIDAHSPTTPPRAQEDPELRKSIEGIQQRVEMLRGETPDDADRRKTGNARLLTDMEVFNRPLTDHVDDETREQVKKRALDAALNVSDKGDAIAAARLLDVIQHGGSAQEIEAKMLDLQAAQRAEDITIRLRNGKTVTIVNDGDGAPEVTVSAPETPPVTYSVPLEDLYTAVAPKQSLWQQRREERQEAAFIRELFTAGAALSAPQTESRESDSGRAESSPAIKLLMAEMALADPFKLTADNTPPIPAEFLDRSRGMERGQA